MLTERQLLVLVKIIEYYTLTGDPVSSKILVDSGDIQASSATVRNDMSTLEEYGLIEKLHTSSGRVPSNAGYQFYVDHLLQPSQLSKKRQQKIEEALKRRSSRYQNIFDQSADILSDLTNYTAIVLGPKISNRVISDIKLIIFNARQMMVILEIDHYVIESQMIQMDQDIDMADLKKMITIFKKELVGCSLNKATYKLKHKLASLFLKTLDTHSWDPLEVIKQMLKQWQTNQVYISGQMNLLDFTDGMDIQSVKSLLATIDDIDELQWIFEHSTEDYQVIMGHESNNQLLKDFAVVSSTYRISPYGEGIIAVLGPTNMSYAQTLGMISALRHEIIHRLING